MADDITSLYQLMLPQVSAARNVAKTRGIITHDFEQYGNNQVNYLDLIFTFSSTEIALDFIKVANQLLKDEGYE